MKEVLVPIDGSECSLRAVSYLVDAAARGTRPRIHIVNVHAPLPTEIGQFVARSAIDDFQQERTTSALVGARTRLSAAGIPFEEHAEVGSPAQKIVELAEEIGCDHIVMGTHGRAAFAEVLVGSTTLKVLHLTKLPVVLVK
jgi:nucleotide-binding universal stress UspA family protein